MSVESWYFDFKHMNLRNTLYFYKLLKNDSKAKILHVTNLNVENVKHLTESLKGNITLKHLIIGPCHIGDNGVGYIADILKYTKITNLCLAFTHIGDNGVKHLAQQLKESQVIDMDVAGNQINHNGLKTLANVWKDGKIRTLRFSNNTLTVKFSKIIEKMFRIPNDEDILFYINDPRDNANYVDVNEMFIRRLTLSDDVNEFVNNFLREIIHFFDQCNWSTERNIEYLKNAVRGVKIKVLYITFADNYNCIFRRICDILKNHLMSKMTFLSKSEFFYYMNCLNAMSSHFQINHTDDMKYFINMLKYSSIRYLSIMCTKDCCFSNFEETLADTLKQTKIVKLDLGNIIIKNIQTFVEKLSNTHVRHLKLQAVLDTDIANGLAKIIEHTQLVSIEFTKNPSENMPTEKYMASLHKNKRFADKINSAFTNLVSLNPESNELKFTTPKNSGPLDLYVSFIKILYKKPNVRAHIVCDRLEMVDEIDEFIDNVQDYFNRFFNDNILNFIKGYKEINFINLINKFNLAKLDQIVENMLLHRRLYYVDESEEILHPLIYKMLHRHKLPLYKKEMEPNKKFDIINYFKTHPELQGIQEAIELLEI